MTANGVPVASMCLTLAPLSVVPLRLLRAPLRVRTPPASSRMEAASSERTGSKHARASEPMAFGGTMVKPTKYCFNRLGRFSMTFAGRDALLLPPPPPFARDAAFLLPPPPPFARDAALLLPPPPSCARDDVAVDTPPPSPPFARDVDACSCPLRGTTPSTPPPSLPASTSASAPVSPSSSVSQPSSLLAYALIFRRHSCTAPRLNRAAFTPAFLRRA